MNTTHVLAHACLEDGVSYSAGSAMPGAACSACWCLRGTRQCVEPACLTPPLRCRPHSSHTPSTCCPQRYICDPPQKTHKKYDCLVHGRWLSEGSRVRTSEMCSQCWCLRGSVHCEPLACAPRLHGCEPKTLPGHCCPHHYHCPTHNETALSEKDENEVLTANLLLAHNALEITDNEDRSLHVPNYKTHNKSQSSSADSVSSQSINDISSNKVKRKTSGMESDVINKDVSNHLSKVHNTISKTTPISYTRSMTTTTKSISLNVKNVTDLPEKHTNEIKNSTEIVNGTVNCSTELSTTINQTKNVTEEELKDVMPRTPTINRMDTGEQTFNPNDIITEGYPNGFDENESFTINVTSSLITNNTKSTPDPLAPKAGTVIDIHVHRQANESKEAKEEFEYDYSERTLPPSLPNLKIIPFVAADAVVDNKENEEKEDFPVLEKEDKYPVYYPINDKIPSANRREDVYNPVNYPELTSEKSDADDPLPTAEVSKKPSGYQIANDLAELLRQYSSSFIKNSASSTSRPVTLKTSTTKIVKPSVSLFSPPVETEGGFVPKGPGIHDEYYAVYPSTRSPHIPHLTTSMQLDTDTGECHTDDGEAVAAGESIEIGCSVCHCVWGKLRCSIRHCVTLPPCHRLPVNSSEDQCCGDLICDKDKTTSTTLKTSTITTTTTTTAPKTTLATTSSAELESSSVKTYIKKNTYTNMTTTNTTTSTQTVKNTKENITTQFPQMENNVTSTNHNFSTTTKAIKETSTPVSSKDSTATTTEFPNPTTLPEVVNDNDNEYEEEEDEGFSFGSVLKLLLSETLEGTSPPTFKKPTTHFISDSTTEFPIKEKSTTHRIFTTTSNPTVAAFVPLPPQRPFQPNKAFFSPTSVNKIDHLVLGEATAIKRTTSKPLFVSKFTSSYKPLSTSTKSISIKPVTTKKPITTIRPLEMFIKTSTEPIKPIIQEPMRPNTLGGGGAGLLKLAGCNIYGKMYRVGKIIAELSTPCQECRCTEFGVQCIPLKC